MRLKKRFVLIDWDDFARMPLQPQIKEVMMIRTDFEKATIFSDHLLAEAAKSGSDLYESAPIDAIALKIVAIAIEIIHCRGHACSELTQLRLYPERVMIVSSQPRNNVRETSLLAFYRSEGKDDQTKIDVLCDFFERRAVSNYTEINNLKMFDDKIITAAVLKLEQTKNWSVKGVMDVNAWRADRSIIIEKTPRKKPYDPAVLFA